VWQRLVDDGRHCRQKRQSTQHQTVHTHKPNEHACDQLGKKKPSFTDH
jgi:hypothetical protein